MPNWPRFMRQNNKPASGSLDNRTSGAGMNDIKLRVARAIDDVLIKAGVGFVDDKLSAAISHATIEAMREPTEAMMAARKVYTDAVHNSGNAPTAIGVWHAMIDEALK